MKKVVVIGDINLDIMGFVDRFPTKEESIHPKDISIRPGGAALNTAISLAINSVDVTLIGAIGNDVIGDYIVKKIERLVDTSFIQKVNATTGIVYILVKGDEKAMIGFKGANGYLQFEKRWVDLLERSSIIHISPYLFSEETGFKIFDRIRHIVKKKIVTLSFSKVLLKEKEKILNLLRDFSFIFMNEKEAQLFAGENEPSRIREELLKYMDRAVITRGEKGAFYIDKEVFIKISGKRGRIINPTGAGDFFAAGFIYGIIKGLSIKDSLKIGVESSYHFISTPNPYF